MLFILLCLWDIWSCSWSFDKLSINIITIFGLLINFICILSQNGFLIIIGMPFFRVQYKFRHSSLFRVYSTFLFSSLDSLWHYYSIWWIYTWYSSAYCVYEISDYVVGVLINFVFILSQLFPPVDADVLITLKKWFISRSPFLVSCVCLFCFLSQMVACQKSTLIIWGKIPS